VSEVHTSVYWNDHLGTYFAVLKRQLLHQICIAFNLYVSLPGACSQRTRQILQRNLNRGTFVVRNEEECVCSAPNILISSKIIKEMPGSVASGTHCIHFLCYSTLFNTQARVSSKKIPLIPLNGK
jgi:hypothetical protein